MSVGVFSALFELFRKLPTEFVESDEFNVHSAGSYPKLPELSDVGVLGATTLVAPPPDGLAIPVQWLTGPGGTAPWFDSSDCDIGGDAGAAGGRGSSSGLSVLLSSSKTSKVSDCEYWLVSSLFSFIAVS